MLLPFVQWMSYEWARQRMTTKQILQVSAALLVSAGVIGCGPQVENGTRTDSDQGNGSHPHSTNRFRRSAGENETRQNSLAQRRMMEPGERLQLIEKLGEVPEDADETDWELAQQTSWWGKPLSAEEFWRARPVWLGDDEFADARRRGRGYPPLPYDDPRFSKFENRDIRPTGSSVEGPVRDFRYTAREDIFWSEFVKSNPHPPQVLKRTQEQLAENIFRSRHLLQKAGNPAGTTEERLAKGDEVFRRRAEESGSPPEALAEEALFWAYVLAKRQQYETARARAANNPDNKYSDQILAKSGVDPKFITEPLTDEQLKAANAWKILYLQRLRRDKTDESYIQAYLNAWNLNETEVFEHAK